jgi:Mor family transcriptional regulator
MVAEEWMQDINPEDLPEPYFEISKLIGLENTLKLADRYQGTGIYLPKLDGVIRKIRDEKIKKEFNGGNYRELARKYGLTEVWVRQITGDCHNENQATLFDLPTASSGK